MVGTWLQQIEFLPKSSKPAQKGSAVSQSFAEFFEKRKAAASAYVSGDGEPVDAMVPHSGEATFHSPTGDTITGANAVARRYMGDAKAFRSNGTSRFEVLHTMDCGELAFWTGFQIATVRIGDMPRPTEMRIRVTEVFRRSGHTWHMIHRHADAAQNE
jgi:ketosteroid isomerase-like protein